MDYLANLRNLGVGRKAESIVSRRALFAGWDELLAALALPSERAPASLEPALNAVAELVSKHPSDFSRPLLPLDDYFALGKKRAPNFHHDRAALHAVAEFYQERLERTDRWDEIDLARAALRGAALTPPVWDLVVCDEVQDLADVQIALLFRLAADPRSIVLTGDPRQIINPTGFRWEEVKYRFRERGLPAPEIRRFSLNFRCVGPIVRLGNALLDLKSSLVGLADTELREEWKFGGRLPVVLEDAAEAQLLNRLRERAGTQVILTRSREEAIRLRELLDTELVFTISEAKGLEFDTVLLWRFAQEEGAEAIWRAIVAGERPDETRLPHVRHELALLYVAVTRARSTLLAWDGESPGPVWTAPGVAALVLRTPDLERLTELWKTVSSPADWEKEGDYYFQRERWAAARECYRNAAAEAKVQRAHARALLEMGNDGEAAPMLELLGEHALAAGCWEKVAEWERARTAWQRAGDPRRAEICWAHLAESRGNLEEAAQAWEALGERARAEALWKRAGAFDRLARSAFSARRYAEAADFFERARMSREAAEAWEKARRYERAGDLRLRLGDHAEAARLFHKARNPEKELRCLQHLRRYREAGLLLEKQGELEKAIEAFAAAASESEESRRRLEEEVPEPKTRATQRRAAVRLAALGRDAEAADLFLKAGALDAAARRYEHAGNRVGVARCHELARRWIEAARELDRAPGTDEERRCAAIQTLLYRHVDAAQRRGREEREVTALVREAERLRGDGNLVAALARYRLCGMTGEAAEVSRQLGWHENVIEWMFASRRISEALSYVKEGGFAISTGFFDKMMETYLNRDASSLREIQGIENILFQLLLTLVQSLPEEEARSRIRAYFDAAHGDFPFLDDIRDEGLALLLRARASATIIILLERELPSSGDPPARLRDFAERLGRMAEESADAGLAACDAFYQDMTRHGRTGDGFERAAGRLPATLETAAILGFSRLRHAEAVRLLMEAGAVEKAERICRVQRDYLLAAEWAERRQDFSGAVGYFRDARDLEGALRCAQASRDERLIARVFEWRGEPHEALRIWKKLKRTSDVERLMKKYPLLR